MTSLWCIYLIVFTSIKFSISTYLNQDIKYTNLTCGFHASENRTKRYLLSVNGGWQKRHLTYFIGKDSVHISRGAVRREIAQALSLWSTHSGLTFQEIGDPNGADFKISFEVGDHGDGQPFPIGTLAHAFFPSKFSKLGGDVHFNDKVDFTESFGRGSQGSFGNGVSFYAVALHELGHSLGLNHSEVKEAVMWPNYQLLKEEDDLHQDDILGLQMLYPKTHIVPTSTARTHWMTKSITHWTTRSTISTTSRTITVRNKITTTKERTTTSSRTTKTTKATKWSSPTKPHRPKEWPKISTIGPKEPKEINSRHDFELVEEHLKHDDTTSLNSPFYPEICNKNNFDAIVKLRDEIFFFRGAIIWRVQEEGYKARGYQFTIWNFFQGLPKTVKRIDAVYERPDGMIVLFTDYVFWVFDGSRFVENSPQPLYVKYGVPNWLREVDAVVNKDDRTYLYKDLTFWSYNEKTGRPDGTYPRTVKRRQDCKYHMEFQDSSYI